MVLRSYDFFESQGDWSKYITVRDAFSGDTSLFLGSVLGYDNLPGTVAEAKSLWSLTIDPVVGDTAFVEADSGHSGNPSQFVIESIISGNITWKFMYSIPIPSGNFQTLTNLVTSFTSPVPDDTHYPSSKAVNDIITSFSNELAILNNTPNIIKIVYDEDISVNIITVTLDMPMPTTHKLVVSSLKTGASQLFTSSCTGNVCTLSFSDAVIVPFLVAIEKL
jgi:hypothetical protein